MRINPNVEDYLRREGIFHGQIQMQQVVADIHAEMDKGLAGENSSLPMIPTYIKCSPQIHCNKKVVALDAGGSNLRAALVHFNDKGKPVIAKFRKTTMPGRKREVSKAEFYSLLVGHFAEFAGQAGSIGLCFSYPSEITPDRDAIPTECTKEVKAPGILGESIISNIRETLAHNGLKSDHSVVVINDTPATLLAGTSSSPEKHYSDYIGFVLGTGMNGCYQESRIPKINWTGHFAQLINTECGSFSIFPRGSVDKKLDVYTAAPGKYLFEKVISGGYFGAYCRVVIMDAVQQGLFSLPASARLVSISSLQTKEVNSYLHNPQDIDNPLTAALADSSDEDQTTLFELLDTLLERAAKLTACCISALVLRNDGGRNPLHPVCVTIDGTTFYRYYRFQSRVESYLNSYLLKKKERYYEIKKVTEAPLIGAAIAALTNG